MKQEKVFYCRQYLICFFIFFKIKIGGHYLKSTEEVLSGGNINKVVKKGDILYREIKGSPMVHQYLAYLEKVGMTGVPRFLGIDSQNREMLSFLPGQTMGNPLPLMLPYLQATIR